MMKPVHQTAPQTSKLYDDVQFYDCRQKSTLDRNSFPPSGEKNHPGLIEYTLKNEPVIPREACGAISRTVAGIIVHRYK